MYVLSKTTYNNMKSDYHESLLSSNVSFLLVSRAGNVMVLLFFVYTQTNCLMLSLVLFLQTIYKTSYTKVWYKSNKFAAYT